MYYFEWRTFSHYLITYYKIEHISNAVQSVILTLQEAIMFL